MADRLFVDDEEVDNSPVQNYGDIDVSGGDLKYRDVNGDGAITVADRVPIGYPTSPEINYGFGGTIGWKGVDFSFYFPVCYQHLSRVQVGQLPFLVLQDARCFLSCPSYAP